LTPDPAYFVFFAKRYRHALTMLEYAPSRKPPDLRLITGEGGLRQDDRGTSFSWSAHKSN